MLEPASADKVMEIKEIAQKKLEPMKAALSQEEYQELLALTAEEIAVDLGFSLPKNV